MPRTLTKDELRIVTAELTGGKIRNYSRAEMEELCLKRFKGYDWSGEPLTPTRYSQVQWIAHVLGAPISFQIRSSWNCQLAVLVPKVLKDFIGHLWDERYKLINHKWGGDTRQDYDAYTAQKDRENRQKKAEKLRQKQLKKETLK